MKTPSQNVKDCLKTWFHYPEEKVFAQVSTSCNDSPSVRTMDLYHVTDEGNLIFMTDTGTKKWNDLKKCPNIAICIVSLEQGQIIAEGSGKLHTNEDNADVAHFYWSKYLEPYWQDFYLSRDVRKKNSIGEIPLSFGVITITPHFWEILEINDDDYLQSSRKQFYLKDDSWIVNKASPV